MKQIQWLLVLGALLAGCSGGSGKAGAPPPPALVQTVGSATDAGLNVFSGEIRARHEADLAFRIGGKIVVRAVELGSRVKAGQPLARLDPADAALQAKMAADQRTLAEAELKRYRELREKNFISQAVLDAKETTYRNADAQARWSGNQSAYTTLLADRDGVITAVNAEPGQVVSAGQPVLRLAGLDELETAISVPESRIASLHVGDAVSIGLWAGADKRYAGKVREIAPAADPVTRTFSVRIAMPDRDAAVKLGMTANAALQDGAGSSVLRVPLAAVVGRDRAATVWVVDPKTQMVAPRPVKVQRYGEAGALVAEGLHAGELIVIAGGHKLAPGQKVRPVTAP
jgi:multidrug efflux system membrane fusion protein